MTTIVIADDEESIRQSVESILEDEGYPFLTADTAERVLTLLTTHPQPLIVLLDLNLPPASVSLPHQIAASPEIRQQHRFLLFSAQLLRESIPEEAEMLATLRSFISGVVPKPCDIETLMKCIHQAEATL
jgi:CheY-like chemotaxis protein